MYFKSAIENLNYALTASGENQKEYLRQARNRFIDATTIEKNENLILSYIGLALCQALTNDMDNSTKTINKIRNVYITLPDDIEELSSMMRYDKEWRRFIAFYVARRTSRFADYLSANFLSSRISRIDTKIESTEESFDAAFNFLFKYDSDDSKLNLKQYFKRLFKALDFYGYDYVFDLLDKENTKRAIKKSCKKILRLLNLKHS